MLENIQRILVPVGFDAFSAEELTTADNLAIQHNAELHVFHAYQDVFKVLSMRTLDLDMNQVEEVLHTEVHEKLDRLLSTVKIKSPAMKIIRKGDTTELILEYAAEAKIDLIVMATHGRAGIESFFLGSVTQKIVRYARCPVLTLRVQTPASRD